MEYNTVKTQDPTGKRSQGLQKGLIKTMLNSYSLLHSIYIYAPEISFSQFIKRHDHFQMLFFI